jgi:hypothetical protein
MSDQEDWDDECTEIPVGDMIVDLRWFSIRFPDGSEASKENDLDQGLVSEAAVAEQPLRDLATAFGLLSEHAEDPENPEGWFLEIDPPYRTSEIELHPGVALESWGTDWLNATVSIGLRHGFDEAFENEIEGIVEPMLRYAGAEYRTSYVDYLFDGEIVVLVRFTDMEGRKGADLIALADDVRALLQAVRSGNVTPEVALNLVQGGHAGALVGQPESQWLEAKGEPWRLGTPSGNAELAKDLSALANAQGGLIVIPAKTTIVSGREILASIGDLPEDLVDITQIRDVLKQWVFPPLPDLITELVPTGEGRVRLVVAVGPHRRGNYPHLVVGDPTGELSKHAVAAWVRDGAGNRAVTAPELHALMAKPSETDAP